MNTGKVTKGKAWTELKAADIPFVCSSGDHMTIGVVETERGRFPEMANLL